MSLKEHASVPAPATSRPAPRALGASPLRGGSHAPLPLRHCLSALLALPLLAAASLILASPAAASPPTVLASYGSGSGRVSDPTSVAVNQSTGEVFVADRNNFRVDEFGSGGEFLLAFGVGVAEPALSTLQTCGPDATPPTSVCHKGSSSGGEGLEPGPLAIDQSDGAIYVGRDSGGAGLDIRKFSSTGQFLLMFGKEVNRTKTEQLAEPGNPHHVTEAEEDLCRAGESCQAGANGTGPGQFDNPDGIGIGGVAVDPSGEVWVGDYERVERFNSAGEFQSEVGLSGVGQVQSLALAPDGDLYVLGEDGSLRKVTPAGTVLYTLDASGNPAAVAVDPASGDVFVSDFARAIVNGSANQVVLLEYSSSGTQLERFGAGEVIGFPAHGTLSFDSASETLYVASDRSAETESQVQVFSLPQPGPLFVEGSESADPRAVTAILHATVDPEGAATECRFQYVDQESFEHEGGFTGPAVRQTPAEPIGSTFSEPVFSAHLSGLRYSTAYRFRVLCENLDGKLESPGSAFETTPPALIEAEHPISVGAEAAVLTARLDPLGEETTYQFQYGTQAGSYGSLAPPVPASAGSGEAAQPVTAQLEGLRPETTYHYRLVVFNAASGPAGFAGPDREFTTTGRVLPPFALPDHRAFELVSPAEKEGAGLRVPFAMSYVDDLRVEVQAGYQAAADGDRLAYLASSGLPGAQFGGVENQNLASRGEGGWSTQPITPPQASTVHSFYPFFAAFSSDLSRSLLLEDNNTEGAHPQPPLVAGEPAGPDLFARDDTTGAYELICGCAPEALFNWPLENLGGFSSDLSRVVVGSSQSLTPGAPTGGVGNLYEWEEGGGMSLLSQVPPSGSTSCGPSGPACVPSPSGGTTAAVSEDGQAVIFFPGSSTSLFLRRGEATVEVSASQKTNGSGPGGADPDGPQPVTYWDASADGTRVFFTSPSELTDDANTGTADQGEDLYRYDADTGALLDLSADQDPDGAEVQGVLGASRDGAYVYFVANGVLASGATRGDCNPKSGITGSSLRCNLYVWHEGSISFIATLSEEDSYQWSTYYGNHHIARLSADGEVLAFDSAAAITPYVNEDAITGKPDPEVYVYDAASGRLRCASCRPTGAAPTGASSLLPAEASIGGPTFYEPRDLSADGDRLFFVSSDAVLPADTNERQDVYEWEAPGEGGCAEAAPAFSAQDGGCLYLISTGTDATDSYLLDASESGEDVFILTASSLVGADTDANLDVYDARVGGGFPEPPPAHRPPCESEEACHGAASQPPLPGSSASSSFAGPEEGPDRPHGTVKSCSRGKVRRRGRCVEKPHHKHKKPHSKRTARRHRRAAK